MSHSLANFMKRFFSHYLPVQKGLSPIPLRPTEMPSSYSYVMWPIPWESRWISLRSKT
jgi:hypothetical protein